MRITRRFINFAQLFCIVLIPVATFISCKGRTAENMEPTGDTVEVVIMQNANVEN